jgi:hypothetical protein
VTIRKIDMHSLHESGERKTETHHMYLPRRAFGHVFEAPIAHPQDVARILAIDRASEKVHRASMPDDILTIAIRERVRRKVPVGKG